MGDRANIVIEEHNGNEIYLYTHWGGFGLPQILQTALRREQRWDDESYLARIIFSEMIRGNEQSDTGSGIATYPPDNEYAFLTVNPKKRTVTIDWGPVKQYHDRPNRVFTFNEFIALEDVSWDALAKPAP